MLVRGRGGRRLLRQADGARREQNGASPRVPLRSGRPGLDLMGSRVSRCNRDLVRAGVGREIRIIDYYEAPASISATTCASSKPTLVYAGHIVPHDAQARSSAPARAGSKCSQSLGLKNLSVAPMHRLEDGINAVRVFMPKCWFDAQKCARGIDALKLYRAEV